MNKIKVLFFMDGIGNAGGIQEMAIKWMENLDWSRYQIDILSYDPGKTDNYPERVKALGGNVYVIPTYMKNGQLFESIKATIDFFKNHKYDVLHAHSSSKAIFVMLFAKMYGIKTRILHSHCTQFIVTKRIPLLLANILKIPTNALTTDYFACSPEAGSFLFGEKALKQNRITIVHNGIDLEKFLPSRNTRDRIRRELQVDGKFVVGNVGRFRYQKNHVYLIDIFAALYKKDPDAVLICVGNGELEEKIKEQAKRLQIDDRIIFLGYRSDVSDIMQAFDLLIMPSLFEGLPVTGVEAQALGVPALFADTITKDAAILPQSSYLSLKQSPEEWADKALEYKAMPKEENPSKYIAQKGYDLKLETKKLEEYYFMSCEKKNA